MLGASVARIEVGAETIAIAVRSVGLLRCIRGDEIPIGPEMANGPTTVLIVPARVRRTGRSTTLVVEGQTENTAKVDRSLLRLIAQAWRLNDLVMSSNGRPIHELAAEVGVGRSYFTRVFRLSFLAPDITKAIVQGRQPFDISAIKLKGAGQFPPRWSDQCHALGFT